MQRLRSLPEIHTFPEGPLIDPPINHHAIKTLTRDSSSTSKRHSRSRSQSHSRSNSRSRSHSPYPCPGRDHFNLLSDQLLLRVFSYIGPDSPDFAPLSLVCRRWLRLSGSLSRRLTLIDWSSLNNVLARFPNLTDVDLVTASFLPAASKNSALLSRSRFSVKFQNNVSECEFIAPDLIDEGLQLIAKSCGSLKKLALVAGNEVGSMTLADGCDALQEMEIHRCADNTLRSISGFKNLQVLKLVGSMEGLYDGPGVSDIGLTILAHGCKRLVKLELSGCEGSYDGISAIGRCCSMLEELTICDHKMDGGWLGGLSFCVNLKSLRIGSCRKIDVDPVDLEHLGSCMTIERLKLEKCQLRDKKSLQALLVVSESVKEVVFQNCWGLDDSIFGVTSICRNVRSLSLEGCSQITTEGLESVVLSLTDLKSLTVVSCNNIRDDAVTPALSNLFTTLKEFKWRPDSKSILSMSLQGTGMGRKGGRFFRRV